MNEVQVFAAQDNNVAIRNNDVVIVTTNHLGSDMSGDSALDAQYLANTSGQVVLGLNRIGSGDGERYQKKLARELTDSPALVTERWAAQICPVLRKRSPSRIELVGRSAGAHLLLHVAALELLPQILGILAIEALRLQKTRTRVGQALFLNYQFRHEGKFQQDRDNIVDDDLTASMQPRPVRAADPARLLARQLVDIRHYQHVWSSDLALKNAIAVAENDAMAACLVFAEDSLAASASTMAQYQNRIQTARGITAAFPLQVITAPRTTHGSFDDQRLYATYYRRFAAMQRGL